MPIIKLLMLRCGIYEEVTAVMVLLKCYEELLPFFHVICQLEVNTLMHFSIFKS